MAKRRKSSKQTTTPKKKRFRVSASITPVKKKKRKLFNFSVSSRTRSQTIPIAYCLRKRKSKSQAFAQKQSSLSSVSNVQRKASSVDEKKRNISKEKSFCFCSIPPRDSCLIGCDSSPCPYGEWFHPSCLSLSVLPNKSKKWYCPGCERGRSLLCPIPQHHVYVVHDNQTCSSVGRLLGISGNELVSLNQGRLPGLTLSSPLIEGTFLLLRSSEESFDESLPKRNIWVQCSRPTCGRWRRVFSKTKSLPRLGGRWVCEMNTWDPARASCSAPQEEDDEETLKREHNGSKPNHSTRTASCSAPQEEDNEQALEKKKNGTKTKEEKKKQTMKNASALKVIRKRKKRKIKNGKCKESVNENSLARLISKRRKTTKNRSERKQEAIATPTRKKEKVEVSKIRTNTFEENQSSNFGMSFNDLERHLCHTPFSNEAVSLPIIPVSITFNASTQSIFSGDIIQFKLDNNTYEVDATMAVRWGESFTLRLEIPKKCSSAFDFWRWLGGAEIKTTFIIKNVKMLNKKACRPKLKQQRIYPWSVSTRTRLIQNYNTAPITIDNCGHKRITGMHKQESFYSTSQLKMQKQLSAFDFWKRLGGQEKKCVVQNYLSWSGPMQRNYRLSHHPLHMACALAIVQRSKSKQSIPLPHTVFRPSFYNMCLDFGGRWAQNQSLMLLPMISAQWCVQAMTSVVFFHHENIPMLRHLVATHTLQCCTEKRETMEEKRRYKLSGSRTAIEKMNIVRRKVKDSHRCESDSSSVLPCKTQLCLLTLNNELNPNRAIVLHYIYQRDNTKTMLKSLDNGQFQRSNVQISLILRKGVGGVALEKEREKRRNHLEQNWQCDAMINIEADVYVSEKFWNTLREREKEKLFLFSRCVELEIRVLTKKWNIRRRRDLYLKRKKYCKNSLLLHMSCLRDASSCRLEFEEKQITTNGIQYEKLPIVKREYFFPEKHVPLEFNVKQWPADVSSGKFRVGVTLLFNIFSPDELLELEKLADRTHDNFMTGKGVFASTVFGRAGQHTYSRGAGMNKLRRTKYFFGARYLWTKRDASIPGCKKAGGIRVDVPRKPRWMVEKIQQRLEELKIIPISFTNAIAMNMYHDGSEGIGSHFDDEQRFARPIVSLRLFSDTRLSFGTHLFSMCNGSFSIDMPRGAVMILEANGFAVDGIKHAIKPSDLSGKSGVIILRHVHTKCLQEAEDILADDLADHLGYLQIAKDDPSKKYVEHANVAQRQRADIEAAHQVKCERICAKVLSKIVSKLEREERNEGKVILQIISKIISRVQRENRNEGKVISQLISKIISRLERESRNEGKIISQMISKIISKLEREEKREGKICSNICSKIVSKIISKLEREERKMRT
eukprot:g1295.t1